MTDLNDGVERHNVYTAYDKVNANECARRVIISRTNPNTYRTPHSKLYGYCLRDLEQQCKVCVFRFDSGAYDTLQFLRVVSHAVGAHTDALQPSQHADSFDDDDDDEQLTPTVASASVAASVPGAPAAADTPLRCCEVCLLAPIEGFALVPHMFDNYNSRCGIIYVFRFVLKTITCNSLHIKVFHRMQYICVCSCSTPSFSSPANSSHPPLSSDCDEHATV